MKHLRTIKPAIYVLGLCGVALFIVLLSREGAGQVGAAIVRAGWGLLAVILYHLLQTLSDAAGWSVLIPKEQRVPLRKSFFLNWIGESINNLLPTGRVGGDIIITRMAAIWGVPLKIATAAMIVDITVGIVTKVFYVTAAGFLLIAKTGRADLARPALVAVTTGTLAATGFYAVQHCMRSMRRARFRLRKCCKTCPEFYVAKTVSILDLRHAPWLRPSFD